jgi:hypothetical protein
MVTCARCLVVLALTTAPLRAAPACESSTECVRRFDVGSVCRGGQCVRYLDERDLLEMIGLKKSRGVLEPWKLYPSIIPAFGYTPQNGFVLGITTLAGIYLGDPETTTISSLGLVAFFTTKSQFIAQSRNVAILEGNAWQLHGDYRLLLTNQSTYGLGSSTDAGDMGFTLDGFGPTATLAGEQPMDFNLVRFHQSVLRRVVGPFYAGGSFASTGTSASRICATRRGRSPGHHQPRGLQPRIRLSHGGVQHLGRRAGGGVRHARLHHQRLPRLVPERLVPVLSRVAGQHPRCAGSSTARRART